MDCSTIQASDFAMPGHTITIISLNCLNNRTISVNISISPALPPGSYNLTATNMTDMCGNLINSSYNINTTAVPVANAGPDAVACSTPGFFGATNYQSVTLTGSGGTSYSWSTGQPGASISVAPSATTTYTLTAIQGSCAATDQVVVTVNASPTPNLGADQTLCSGFPVTLNASGGGTYQWQSTTSTFFGSPSGWVNIAGATSATLTITPGTTIYYRVLVTSPAGCVGNDFIKITLGAGSFGITAPPFVCNGASATLSLPAAMTAYTWTVAGTPIGTANTPLTISPVATTTYTATSTTVGCVGSANVTIPVHTPLALATSANPLIACAGTPVNLNSTGPINTSTTETEGFEGANTYALVNGTYNNWRVGTAAFATGAQGLYIGTAATNNNYSISSGFGGLTSNAATNHAYKDYTVTSYCTATLSYAWKCGGNANAALTVWAIPTSVTPVAGTALIASATQVLLGTHFGTPGAYTTVSADLSQFAGQNIRIVFSWKNSGGFGAPAVVPPAASIDNITFAESSTYNYSWTSSPAGFTSSSINTVASPTVPTNYSLTVTRCDGCPVTSVVAIGACSPLPIELYEFAAIKKLAYNKVTWSTESENGNDYYTLERSTDGYNWKNVAELKSKGNSTQMARYNFDDYTFDNNVVNYYRLLETDLSGKQFNIGNVIAINNLKNSQIAKRVNILGQEVSEFEKGLIFLIYSNGDIEKTIIE